MKIGQRIKDKRKSAGISAENLAKMIGISPATVYRYENGEIKDIPSGHIRSIATILQTTPNYLMGWDVQEDNTNNRIRELRKSTGLTMKQLGERIGVSESAISNYETGQRQLVNEMALKIADFFDVSVGYLLGLEEAEENCNLKLGAAIKDFRKKHSLSQRQFAEICKVSNGYISILEKGANPSTGRPVTPTIQQLKKLAAGMKTGIAELFEMINNIPVQLDEPNIIPMPEMRKIPLIGAIACGKPILAEEHIEEYVEIPKHVAADFALSCKGDSMINARIFDGDVVYIRQQATVENGEIAAVLIDGEATLKRVKFYEDRISLEPENPTYRPIVLWGEEMNEARILGKAVAFTSAVR